MKTLLQKAFYSLLFVITVQQSNAQTFLPAIERFSGKKEGFLVTTKGDTTKFLLDDLDRKKGLIVNVAGNDVHGKKFEYKADQIRFLALAPADYAKFAAFSEGTGSVLRASKTDFKQINRDLIFFYQEYLEDKKRTVLVQLVNPGFDNNIRVYSDPFAKQTSGVTVGGVQMTGGMDKSYYVNYNGKTYRLYKKDYDKKFKEFFGNCPEMKAKYKNGAWRDFAEHLFLFDQSCNNSLSKK
jgi:hypothetical protein